MHIRCFGSARPHPPIEGLQTPRPKMCPLLLLFIFLYICYYFIIIFISQILPYWWWWLAFTLLHTLENEQRETYLYSIEHERVQNLWKSEHVQLLNLHTNIYSASSLTKEREMATHPDSGLLRFAKSRLLSQISWHWFLVLRCVLCTFLSCVYIFSFLLLFRFAAFNTIFFFFLYEICRIEVLQIFGWGAIPFLSRDWTEYSLVNPISNIDCVA